MIAKEVVTRCDKCGEAGDDVRTYTLRLDGSLWELDLDEKHAKTVTVSAFMTLGRQTDSALRRPGTGSLERRIRGLPSGTSTS